jgi:hypothetical protein
VAADWAPVENSWLFLTGATSQKMEFFNLHAICKHSLNFASPSAFQLKSSGTLQWIPIRYLAGWFLESVLLGLLADVPLAMGQRLWYQHDRAPMQYGEHAHLWLKATQAG